MKSFICGLSFFITTLAALPALAGPPVSWNPGCSSGIYNLALGSCLAVGTGVTSVSGTAPVVSSGGSTPAISMPVSTNSVDGYLSAADHTTFAAKQAALTLGNLTDIGTDGISITGGTGAVVGSGAALSQHVADASHNGYLLSADWSTFNGKQAALGFTPENVANKATDTTMGGGSPSDVLYASQKAVKAYIDAAVSTLNSAITAAITAAESYADALMHPDRRYVAYLNGNDTTGTGSLFHPWKTVQKACTSLASLASINNPYTVWISGGNNPDSSAITCSPNVNLYAEYPLQVKDFTISGGALNDGFTATNIIFLAGPTWVRNDTTVIGMSLINSQSFSGPTFKQQGVGSATLSCTNCLTVNADLLLPNLGSFFFGATLLGTTSFGDVTSAVYYEFIGGYSSSAITIRGGAEAYFSGMAIDTPFGSSLTLTTTGNGTPVVQSDSSSLPPTFTGSPTLNLTAYSQYVDFTKGALLGGLGAPASTNVLLQVKDGHSKSSQTTAPTATVQANAGTGSSCSVANSTDSAGQVTITTGTLGISTGSYCLVNFNKAYGVAPICTLTPASSTLSTSVYATSSTSALAVNFAVAGGVSNTYVLNFNCIETQ